MLVAQLCRNYSLLLSDHLIKNYAAYNAGANKTAVDVNKLKKKKLVAEIMLGHKKSQNLTHDLNLITCYLVVE